MSYHEHNAAQRSNTILSRLRLGQAIALVTDAGMPAVSDPVRNDTAVYRIEKHLLNTL